MKFSPRTSRLSPWYLAPFMAAAVLGNSNLPAQGLSSTFGRLEETRAKVEARNASLQGSQDNQANAGDRGNAGSASAESSNTTFNARSSRPVGGQTVSPSDTVSAYAGRLITMLRHLDLEPLFAPVRDVTTDSGPVLAQEADLAFQSGHHGLARELMFGHMVTEYQNALVPLHTVKYSSLLRRPVWNIRFGVSMAVRGNIGPLDRQPIREGKTPARIRSGAGNGIDDEDEEEYEDEEMEPDRPSSRSVNRTALNHPNFPERKMLSEAVHETMDQSLGLVAEVVAKEFNERFQKGDFGSILVGSAGLEPLESATNDQSFSPPVMSEALNATLMEAVEPLPMWQPGLVFLGEGGWDEQLPTARDAGIDIILHFDVVLKAARNDTVQNISRCRLIHVASQKSLGVSKGIDNLEAAQMASRGRMGERAYVEEQLATLLGIIDRQLKVVDLPKLSPEVARRRIASLIASSKSRTLRTLAEVRLYQAQKLIDAQEVESAFDIIGGVEALHLLHAPRDQRLRMVRKWASKSDVAGEEF